MLTKNNWVYTTLDQRLANPNLDFSVTLFPYPFEEVDFITAAKNVAVDIADNYHNLYLGLSGGLDSEFILRLFSNLGIKIKPVIISHYSNQPEVHFALAACKELGIDPIIIEPNDAKNLIVFNDQIFKKMNSHAIYSIFSIVAAEYVNDQNGILLTGGNVFGDQGNSIDYFTLSEWDFYYSIFYPNLIHISPLMYTPQIVKSFVNDITEDWHIHKSKKFGIALRNKMQPIYTDAALSSFRTIVDYSKSNPANQCVWKIADVFNKNSFDQGIIGTSQHE